MAADLLDVDGLADDDDRDELFRFAVGDRVESRWGLATVLQVDAGYGVTRPSKYRVRHDSDPADSAGHWFAADELEPG